MHRADVITKGNSLKNKKELMYTVLGSVLKTTMFREDDKREMNRNDNHN